MLKVNIRGRDVPSCEVIDDIEARFMLQPMTVTEPKRALLKEIEQGEFAPGQTDVAFGFIDRFGYKLRPEDMSTGCKAGFLVDSCPGKCVDLLECGDNAVAGILRRCHNGEVLLSIPKYTIDRSGSCNLQCFGRRFSSMAELSRFIEWGEYIGI